MNRNLLTLGLALSVLGIAVFLLYMRRFEAERAGGEPVRILVAKKSIARGKTVQLQNGDQLLFYTDGVTEAHGPAGLFGSERLVNVVTKSAKRGANLLDQLLAAVTEFSAGRPAEDDMTLLVAELTG